jgi:RHS repeat-associated protein
VTRVTTDNGIQGQFAESYTTSYDYDDPVYDARDRAFVGFSHVTATRKGDAAAPGTVTRITFVTQTCPSSPGNPCSPMIDYKYRLGRGLPAAREVSDEKGKHLLTTVYTYPGKYLYTGLDGRAVHRAWNEHKDLYIWDPNDQASYTAHILEIGSPHADPPIPYWVVDVTLPKGSKKKHLRETEHFDSFGNRDVAIDWGEVDDSLTPVQAPIVTTSTWQLPPGDPSSWSYRVYSQAIGYGTKQGLLPHASRETQFTWNSIGLLATISGKLTGTAALDRHNNGNAVAPPPADSSVDGSVTLATLFYDSVGNLVRIQTPNQRCADMKYDPTHQQLPTAKLVYRDGCGAKPLTTSRTFDRGLGVVRETVGPDSKKSAIHYDVFGRILEVFQPDARTLGNTDPLPVLRIDYSLADAAPVRKVHISRIDGSGANPTYAESWLYLDGFGRKLASLAQGETAGKWIVSGLKLRTAVGRIGRILEPSVFLAADASSYSLDTAALPDHDFRFTYDALGQGTSTTGLDGKTITYSYSPLEFAVDVKDAEQSAPGPHTGSFTRIARDAFGRVVNIAQHFANDPKDVITTLAGYEATGEMTLRMQGHDANGNEIVWHQLVYDSLGSLVRSREQNSSVNRNGSLPVGWTYAYNDNGDLVGTSDARGCGENFVYDRLGRLVSEDYSPCTLQQGPYSSPQLATGKGVERLNIYDQPVVPDPNAAVYQGRLTATFDRAQKSSIVLDARGRTTIVRRQLAVPNAGSAPFAKRYAPRVYQKVALQYDQANRALSWTTGADAPELAPPFVGSWVTTRYTPRGTVASVTSSYGDLLASEQVDEFGAVTQRVLGDAAHTTMTADYYPGRTLKSLHYFRGPGPWIPASPSYFPPAINDLNTLQGELANLLFSYDDVSNPLKIADLTNLASWPGGAKPASSKTFTYDDAYRLRTAQVQYGSGDDEFVSPLAPEARRGDKTFPLIAGGGNRVRGETFQYDWLGNTTLSDDDAHLPDRSPGAMTNGLAGPNQLALATQGGVKVSPTYDEAGNVRELSISRSTPCAGCPADYFYLWDEVGNLAMAQRFDAPGVLAATVTYAYDASGIRILKSVSDAASGTVKHTADVFDTLRLGGVSFPDANGDYEHTAHTERVYLASGAGVLGEVQYVENDIPSKSSGRTRVFFALGDHLGSTSFVIDKETGELVERATYESFGATESDYRPDRWANFRSTYRYTGHADDAEVGAMHFGARYYSPGLGRWLSPDPLTVHTGGGDMNAYAFVRGSPMRFTDPVGLDTFGCDNLSPGCGPLGSSLDGIPGIISGFWQSLAGGGGTPARGPSRGSGTTSTPPPPSNPGVAVKAADNGAQPFQPYANESWLSRTINTSEDPVSRLIRSRAFDKWLAINEVEFGAAAAIALLYLGGEGLGAAEDAIWSAMSDAAFTRAVGTVAATVGAGAATKEIEDAAEALPATVARAFEAGQYEPGVLAEDMTVFRAEGTPFGSWFGTVEPESAAHAEKLYNIVEYGNDATEASGYLIPKGTTIFRGPVAGGTGIQVFVPDPRAAGVQLLWTKPLVQFGF